MEENAVFDVNELAEAMVELLSVELADALELAVTDKLESVIHNALPEALQEFFGDSEVVLKDGTVVKPRQHMMLMSPDKTKYLSCYGGLRVDETSLGPALIVQTRISSWELIARYSNKEEAVADLLKVKKAMHDGMSMLEL